MTKIYNDPADFSGEALSGFAGAFPKYVQQVPGGLVRAGPPTPGKVAVVIGGGTGHYPAFAGWVGPGMADGAVVGDVFASPSTQQIVSVALAADAGGGIFLSYGNYAGDVLNFNAARDQLIAAGVPDPLRRRHRRPGLRPTRGPAPATRHRRRPHRHQGRRRRGRGRLRPRRRRGRRRPRQQAHLLPGRRLLRLHAPGIRRAPVHPRPRPDGRRPRPARRARHLRTTHARAPPTSPSFLSSASSSSAPKTPRRQPFSSTAWAPPATRSSSCSGTKSRPGWKPPTWRSIDPEVGELVTSLDMAGVSLTIGWLDDESRALWCAPANTPAYRKIAMEPVPAARPIQPPAARAIPAASEASRLIAKSIVAALESAAAVARRSTRRNSTNSMPSPATAITAG